MGDLDSTSIKASRAGDAKRTGDVDPHAETLRQIVRLICGSDDLERDIAVVLDLCARATSAETWCLLRRSEGLLTVLAAAEPGLRALVWDDPDDVLGRELKATDLAASRVAATLPQSLRDIASALSTPVVALFEPPMAILLLSRRPVSFSHADQELLRRTGQALAEAIDHRHFAEQTEELARPAAVTVSRPAPGRFLGTSFEALGRAYAKMAAWQGSIVEITNELMTASSPQADPAIERALARTGELAKSDRTYVFRLRPPDRLDNTHEWVAAGIEPMIEHLQDMPDSLLEEWLPDLSAGRAVHIPDVEALPQDSSVRETLRMQGILSLLAVPMLREGEVTGFVGYDAVRAYRTFLPVEIQLLQSVANAINVLLERSAAERAAQAAQRSLEKERDRLRATLAAIPDLVLECDRDGRFSGHVPGAGLRPAFPHTEFLGKMPEEVLPAELTALARHVMQAVDRDGQAENWEYELIIDGEPRWFAISAAGRYEDDAPDGYVFVIRDITKPHQEGRLLLRLGKIAELTSNPVVVTDAERRIEWVNPAFERRTGWTLEEVLGRQPDDFLSSDQTDQVELSRIVSSLRAGRSVRADLLNRGKSGEDYWISQDIQPLFGSDGVVEGFISVQTDITDLKMSQERELRDMAVALDSSNDGIAITDADGHYTYMNRSHRRMFGIGDDEDVRELHWRELYTSEMVERFLAENWNVLVASGEWRGLMTGRHRNGQPVPQEVSLTLRDGGILCITRDISERLRLDAERTQLREELQVAQRRETVAQLAGGLAHDLNNLVAVVSGSASMMMSYCAKDEEARAGLDRIVRAADAARDIVQGMSHLGRRPSPRAEHDLRDLLGEAVELLGSKRLNDHQVTVSTSDHPRPIWANVTEVMQVILNLALNACEAGREGSNRVGVAILDEGTALPDRRPDAGLLRREADHVAFTITDTGDGIPEAVRVRLFEPYFTTKGDSGTGLGLSIVAGILRENSAALWLDSVEGKGTTVTVAWPASPREAKQIRKPPFAVAGTQDIVGRNILIVDDIIDVADVLSEMLEMAGAIGISVSDPEEALELLRQNSMVWSVLVTDLNMPGMRGTDLARAAAGFDPPIPTILVTALPEEVGEDEGLFHAVLAKPITADVLVAAVASAAAGAATARGQSS